MATDSINLDCVELKRGNYIKLTITSNLESVKILENEKLKWQIRNPHASLGHAGGKCFLAVGVGWGWGGATRVDERNGEVGAWGGWRGEAKAENIDLKIKQASKQGKI